MPIANVKQSYKLGLVCSNWTPQLKNRAMRDVLSVSRLARTAGVQFEVAVDQTFGETLNTVIGVQTTADLVECSLYRVYIDRSIQTSDPNDPLSMLPDDANFELVEINVPKDIGGLVVEKDPYSGVKMFKDWQHIPPTIDLDKPAPPWVVNDEPQFSPFL